MKRLLLSLNLFLWSMTMVAQSGKGQLSGKLEDSAGRQPLSLATVTVFRASDTSIISFRLTNPQGEFKVPGIPHNVECRMVISFTGYRTIRKEFVLTNNAPSLDVGTILMEAAAGLLEEVLVLAERPPVIVRNDTIEFNASSFRTLPTALVEDLLRKLPGVQVDGNGDVAVNGRKVNRILVDGKSFFGDDPKMATRNLPADIIDKVQVTDDKEQINRAVDGNLSNIGKVINLTLKKGVKKGWFGKVHGGVGTDDRYEAGAIGNIFRDTLQLSILGFSNNISRSAFTMKDVQQLGGFNRSGANTMMMSDRGGNTGFAINNFSFGGLESGITRTTGAGFNLNHAPNAKKSFFLQYLYGEIKNRIEEKINNQQFIVDTIIKTRTTAIIPAINKSHTVGAGIKLKPDSVTDINLRASLSAADKNSSRQSLVSIDNNKQGALSIGDGRRFYDGSSLTYNHNFDINKRWSQKKGRVLDLSHGFSYDKNAARHITEQTNYFTLPIRDTALFEQLRVEDIPNISGSLNGSFTEPLRKDLSIRLSEEFQYTRNEQQVTTFGRNEPDGKYTLPNALLSNEFTRQHLRSASTAALTYNAKGLRLTAGISALRQTVNSRFIKTAERYDLDLLNIIPTISIEWKKFNFSYSENVLPPSTGFVNPVVDNTNPLFIRESNLQLRAAKSREIRHGYYNFFPNANLNLNWFVYGRSTNDDVILARTINELGVQVEKPVNTNGTKDAQLYIRLSKDFKNKPGFVLSVNTSFYSSYHEQALIVNTITGRSKGLTISPSAGLGFNWNDVVELRPNYRLYTSSTRYSNDLFPRLRVPIHTGDAEIVVRWPRRFTWESNINYRGNPQVAAGMPKSNTLWNAGLTYSISKNDRSLLRLGVYDILNSNNDFYRQATQNYISETQTNILQRYFMLTYTFNFRLAAPQGKLGGRERLFVF